MTVQASQNKGKEARNERWRSALPLTLFVVLLIQSVASLSLHNTAYRDEALYLWAGHQLIHQWQGGPQTDDLSRFFSGLPYIYPVLGGWLDMIGGLEFARLFSLCCMLTATSIVYVLTHSLYGKRSAIFASALFAGQGSVLFLGHFATFDAMCLALLAGAALLALKAGSVGYPEGALLVGVMLLLAAATKYAGLLYVPTVLFLMGWQTQRRHGWPQAFLRVGMASGVIVLGAALLLYFDDSALAGINYTTLERVAMGPAPQWFLARRALSLGGGLAALALVGTLLDGNRRNRPLLIVLLATAFLAPIYHIVKSESISLHKHIAFGLFFAAPLAGYAVDRLSRLNLSPPRWHTLSNLRTLQNGRLVGIVVCSAFFSIGVCQAHQEFRGWQNSNAYIQALRANVRPGDRILAEVVEVPGYYLQDVVGQRQLSFFAYFKYTDPAGNDLYGEKAFQAAIAAGYFDVVILHYGDDAVMAHAIDPGLNDGKRYVLIVKQPGSWIWRKKSKAPVQAMIESQKSLRQAGLETLILDRLFKQEKAAVTVTESGSLAAS